MSPRLNAGWHPCWGMTVNAPVLLLEKSLGAWETTGFREILKQEIAQLGTDQLPLQQGLTHGSVALDDNLDVIIISTADNNNTIQVKTGIYYGGVIAGSCCADDPTPVDKTTEYCEVLLEIDMKTAKTSVTLLAE